MTMQNNLIRNLYIVFTKYWPSLSSNYILKSVRISSYRGICIIIVASSLANKFLIIDSFHFLSCGIMMSFTVNETLLSLIMLLHAYYLVYGSMVRSIHSLISFDCWTMENRDMVDDSGHLVQYSYLLNKLLNPL